MKILNAAIRTLSLSLFLLFFICTSNSIAQSCVSPQNLALNNVSSAGFDLSWDPVPGALGYELDVKVNAVSVFSSAVASPAESITYPVAIFDEDVISVELRTLCSGGMTSAYTNITWVFSTVVATVEVVYLTDPAPCETDCKRTEPSYLQFEDILIDEIFPGGSGEPNDPDNYKGFFYEKVPFCICLDDYMGGVVDNPPLLEALENCIRIMIPTQLEDPNYCGLNKSDQPNRSKPGQEVKIYGEIPVTIAPNPFNEFLELRFFSEKNAEVKISLYNQLGQLITFYNEAGSHQSAWQVRQIRTDFLEKGMYIVEIITNGGRQSFKIIKQ